MVHFRLSVFEHEIFFMHVCINHIYSACMSFSHSPQKTEFMAQEDGNIKYSHLDLPHSE